jgi:hypothetical protein
MFLKAPVAPISHWNHLIENFHILPREFYSLLEKALSKREIPDATTSRVAYKEAGLHSAERQYLRVERGRFVLDICAAPYGNGYFFSWWLAERRPSPFWPTLAALGILWLWGHICGEVFGRSNSFLFTIVGWLVIFWSVGALMSEGESAWAQYVLVIPFLGRLYQRYFLPDTYYRMDTASMFEKAVHSAVLAIIDGLTQAKGVRGLSEMERRPIHRDFYQSQKAANV